MRVFKYRLKREPLSLNTATSQCHQWRQDPSRRHAVEECEWHGGKGLTSGFPGGTALAAFCVAPLQLISSDQLGLRARGAGRRAHSRYEPVCLAPKQPRRCAFPGLTLTPSPGCPKGRRPRNGAEGAACVYSVCSAAGLSVTVVFPQAADANFRCLGLSSSASNRNTWS